MQVFNDNIDHDNIDSVFITLFGDDILLIFSLHLPIFGFVPYRYSLVNR